MVSTGNLIRRDMTGSARTAARARPATAGSWTEVAGMAASIVNARAEVARTAGLTPPAIPASKFASPLPPATHVRRPELAARVCRAAVGGVTLLRAPTGCGKTTLMQACREELREAGVAT